MLHCLLLVIPITNSAAAMNASSKAIEKGWKVIQKSPHDDTPVKVLLPQVASGIIDVFSKRIAGTANMTQKR